MLDWVLRQPVTVGELIITLAAWSALGYIRRHILDWLARPSDDGIVIPDNRF